MLEVELPPGVSGTVHIPTPSADAVMEGGTPATKAVGVTQVSAEGREAVFSVESGKYAFSVPFTGSGN